MGQGADSLYVKKPFILAVVGTSLSYPSDFGGKWWQRLYMTANGLPEAVGPVVLRNFAAGGAQSSYGVTIAPEVAAINPTHILSEGFAINDSAPAIGGGVSRPQHLQNMADMRAIWKAKNPAVDITWQTMNGVSAAGQPGRPDLPLYYADEIQFAGDNADTLLDHYNGVPSPPAIAGGWPKPLPDYLTMGGDGLHPLWADSLEVYFWPGLTYWLRCKMAAYWGLPIPNPPEPPPLPDASYALIGGGGGGGGAIGGGGGAGGLRRGVTSLANLLGLVTIGKGGLPGTTRDIAGVNGTATTLGGFVAEGGGGGGAYSSSIPLRTGRDGGSGGGGGDYDVGGGGGLAIAGQGYPGGNGDGFNGASGGGGGARGAGATPVPGGGGGQGGLGWTSDVPGQVFDAAAGGPGGSWNYGARPAYRSGAGPTAFGGGGYGGGSNGVEGAGQAGGNGAAFVWYPGAARAVGGTVTTFGGFTVHKFTRADYGPGVVMTADNAPAGYAAAASTIFNGNYLPFKAFNGAIASDFDRWASAADALHPHWLRLTLPNARGFRGYRMVDTSASATTPNAQQPKTWTVFGSNDLVNFAVVDQRTDVPARTPGVDTFYECNGPAAGQAFLYYQVNFFAQVGNDRNIVSVVELEFLPGLTAI